MENDKNVFCPMPTPPPELARALGWRLNPSPEEVEEQASMDLFTRTTAISNPWTVKPGVGGVIEYGDDDAREAREYAASIEPVAKLFEPKHAAATTPTWNLAPPVKQDADEEIYYAALAPLQKLFAGNAITTTAPTEAANRFHFTKRATTPAPKEKPTLRYEKVLEGGETWCKGYDATGELVSMLLVTDESD